MTISSTTITYVAPVEERRARWGPICGVIFVVLVVVSTFIYSAPSTGESPQYLLNWYSQHSHKRAVNISTVIGDVGVVFGLFWFGYLRDRFSRSDVGVRLAPVFMAGVVLFAGGGLVFSGAQFALGDNPKKMDPATAQTLNFLSTDIVEVRYGSYAARLSSEYRIPLYHGTRSVYGVDFFSSAGLYGLANAEDFTRHARGYTGFATVPIDLTFNLGLKIDTSAGGFTLGLSNFLGFIPVRGKTQ